MIRAYLAAAGFAVLLLVAPLTAGAMDPPDRFNAAISPSAVQPLGLGSYTISITNLPNSSPATQGSIAIPGGFLLGPPQATIGSGSCAGPSWSATLSASSIDLAAPDASSALCDGGTLAVTFSVLAAPLGDGQYVWTTSLSAGGPPFDAQSQPTLFVDGTPPDTAIQGSPPAITDATAGFSFSGGDGSGSGVAGFQCSLDGTGFAGCTSPTGFSGLDSGLHTFAVRALDPAGNVDLTPDAVTWTVDATPPQTTIEGHPPSLSASRSANFGFAGSDSGSGLAGFQCSLDGAGFSGCADPASYGGLSDGPHEFEVRAVDAVGNVDPTPGSYPWTIDATAPPMPIIEDPPSNPSDQQVWTFHFHDGDPTATLWCRLDGGPFSDCSSGSFATGILLDGHHSFEVKAVDPVGNPSVVAPYEWTIDTVHPLVTVTDSPPLLTNQTDASFSFVANKPGSTYQCSLDGAAFAACTSPKLYGGLGNGSHTFRVRGVWLALIGPPTAYTWTVDTVPPQTTISSAPPAASKSASATFAFSSSETESTFACRLDGGGFVPCTSPKTYVGLGDGRHTFSVEAVDRAGNADPSAAGYAWQISGVGPPTQDLRPPRNVRQVKRNVGYGRLQIRWRNPADSDFDHVGVFVSTKRSTPARTLVYKGKKQLYANRRFKNGLYYRYVIVSYDHSDNASGGTPATVPPSALLRSPRDGRVVHAPPLLRWTPVRKARFYNVQLYYRGQKVLSAWPAKPRRALVRRWTYSGRGLTLRRGTYLWYVWPGFGTKSKSRYGQLLGQGAFKVR